MKKTIIALGLALVAFVNVAATEIKTPETGQTSFTIRTTTPLCVAISKGELDVVKKFVEYGADVNEKSNGLTPLMIAATYNQSEIIKYLLTKGADVKIKNESGFTALTFAQRSNSTEAAAILVAAK